MSQPCDTCSAPCCRAYTTYLNGLDAYRIGRALHLPLAEFLNLELSQAPDERFRIALSPVGESRYRLHLRKVPDPDPVFGARCTFLITVGTQGRCGIYDVRPGQCATYPTTQHDGLIDLGGDDYCPPNGWRLESLDLNAFRQAHRRRDRDQLVYHAIVDRWNARIVADQLSYPEWHFYDFLYNVYGALEKTAPALVAEPKIDPTPTLAVSVDAALKEMGWP